MGHSKEWPAALLACMACLISLTSAHTQDFPTNNIRLIVNVAAGGVTDTLARLVGQGLSEKWGKPVIVENLVGGHSALAAQAVMRAKPDGHTLFVTADAPFTTTPLLVKKLNFTLADFTPITMICQPVPMFAVKPSLGVKTLHNFLALAKSQPGTLSYGSQGVGTYGHLGMEDFKQRTGIDMIHVPYRGGSPALQGLVRGDVTILINNYANLALFEQSRDVVMIAAAGSRRSDARPDIPTAMEQGVPGFSVSTWFGIFGAAGTPPDVVAKIRDGVEAVLESEKSNEFFKINSCERMQATPQQMRDIIAADYNHWRKVIQTVGLQME
jgi:tripartite-type tricarboxylate transporter receptor subunit TctC